MGVTPWSTLGRAALTRLPGGHVDGGAGGARPRRVVRLDREVVERTAPQVGDLRGRLISESPYFPSVFLLVTMPPVFNLTK